MLRAHTHTHTHIYILYIDIGTSKCLKRSTVYQQLDVPQFSRNSPLITNYNISPTKTMICIPAFYHTSHL